MSQIEFAARTPLPRPALEEITDALEQLLGAKIDGATASLPVRDLALVQTSLRRAMDAIQYARCDAVAALDRLGGETIMVR